jgi:hypothetical protein
MTLREYMRTVRTLVLRADSLPVERTVAERLHHLAGADASIVTNEDRPTGDTGRFRILLLPEPSPAGATWRLRIDRTQESELRATHGSLLYAICTLMEEEWSERPVEDFGHGIGGKATFPWFRNLSDFLVGSLRSARHFKREDYFRQIARQGFTHVSINGLGIDLPFETSPPGDVYFWFYDYSPDLDQFVDSSLIRGYYPAEYLLANMKSLKENARLARKYGLTPGLHINSPRSMPEEFWQRYGFLRGARVDHPRETLRPRYTLAMAHPAVQNHYREMVRSIMAEVPEIGFMHVWTNDSGSGFEFVSSLYAGRNGGPYLIREWKSDREIARKAGQNVLTYYHLLRDEARKVNPGFRLVCDLGPFMSERDTIIPGLGKGIDVGDFGYFEGSATPEQKEALQATDAETHVRLEIGDNNVLGVPSPMLVHERLRAASGEGFGAILTGGTPESLAPYDINREVARFCQIQPAVPLREVLLRAATRWGGAAHAGRLLEIWELSDTAARGFPAGIPMSTFGFPWFRLWIRPFVPDIDAVPESERAYYERYLLATFNNPARIDLNNDMMWNFLTVQEAAEKKRLIDQNVLAHLGTAIDRCREISGDASAGGGAELFRDLGDRLRAARCFYGTMRNTMAWTESVHGYCQSAKAEAKRRYRGLCRDMVDHELQNARELLQLWQVSRVDFMPVSARKESLHIYGENFGEQVKRKIALMERHRDNEPKVDPEYMWRMPRS